MKSAVIYARVSGERQVSEGNGIASQIHRCEQYCALKNYTVKQIFKDEGVSGKIENRPGVVELLAYLTQNKGTAIIVDDQKRLARDIQVYLHLKQAIKALNCTIEYLNHTFDDSPESNFIETILASTAQLEREQGARQVRQKMKARLEAGFWIHKVPIGYKIMKVGSDKLPVIVEPHASIVKEMYEKFVSRELKSISDCLEFLTNYGIKTSKSAVHKMIHNVLYAGYLEYPNWEVPLTKAKHEPIISFELFKKAQELVLDGSKFKKSNHDFELKGYVICSECGNNLTAGYSTSRNGTKHGYYMCQGRKCPLKSKTFRKHQLEGDFVNLLKNIEITDPEFYILAKDVWLEAIGAVKQTWIERRTQMIDRISVIDKEIVNLVNRISKTGNDLIAETFENRIGDLDKERIILREKIRLSQEPDLVRAESIYNQVIQDYRNVSNQWISTDKQGKSLIFQRVFEGRITVDKNGVYRTTPLSLFYQQKSTLAGDDSGMVDYTGRLLNIVEAVKKSLYEEVYVI